MTVARRAAAVVGLLTVTAAVVVGLARTRVDTRPESFLPRDDPAAAATARAASAFGADPIVVLLEASQAHELTTGEQLSALLRLEGRLARLPDVATAYGPATVLNQLAQRAQEMLGELTGRRDGLRIAGERGAIERGEGPRAVAAAGNAAVADFDRRYGPLIVAGMPSGLPTTRNGKFVDRVLYGPGGLPNPQWRFVVPSDRSVAVLVRPREALDQAGAERLTAAVRDAVAESGVAAAATVSGAPVVATEMAGAVRYELPVLGGAALLAVGAWLWLVPWTQRRYRLLPLASTIVATASTLGAFGLAGLPLSLGTVAFLPILLGVGSEFMTYLTRGADRRTVVSVAVAAAASFASLGLVTPVPAIAELGFALGVGTIVAVGTSVVLAGRLQPAHAEPAPAQRATARPGRGQAAALVAVAVVAVVGWTVLPSVPVRADVSDFAGGGPALQDAEHVEQVLGSGAEIGVLVEAPDVLDPATYVWSDRIRAELVSRLGDRLRPVLSPSSLMAFLGPRPTAEQITAAHRLLPPYLAGAVVTPDRTRAMLSFGVRMDAMATITQLRADIAQVLRDLPPPAGVSVEPVGLPLIAAGGYAAVSENRYLHNGVGIAAAALVLVVGLRRRSDAWFAVGASLLATGAGVAALWVAAVPFTPLTIGLGSLTAAVGCEFAVLLRCATHQRDRGLRRAVQVAAVASGTGYAVLAFSQLSVIAEFGVLLAASVALAYGCAALLAMCGTATRAPNPSAHATEPVGVI